MMEFLVWLTQLAARSWNPMKSKLYDGKVPVDGQQASTSAFEDSEDLTPIVYEEANRSSSPTLSGIPRSLESDPLEENNQNCESRHLIFLPASTEMLENDEVSDSSPSVINATEISPALSRTFRHPSVSSLHRISKQSFVHFLFILAGQQCFVGKTGTKSRPTYLHSHI